MDREPLAEEIASVGRLTTRLWDMLAGSSVARLGHGLSARPRGHCHRPRVAADDVPRGLPVAGPAGAGVGLLAGGLSMICLGAMFMSTVVRGLVLWPGSSRPWGPACRWSSARASRP